MTQIRLVGPLRRQPRREGRYQVLARHAWCLVMRYHPCRLEDPLTWAEACAEWRTWKADQIAFLRQQLADLEAQIEPRLSGED